MIEEKQRGEENSKRRAQIPKPQILPKGKLSPHIRNMKGTNPEVSQNKKLLSQGGIAESKDTALSFSEKTQDKKSQNHGSKSIHHAPKRIPKYIIFHKGNLLLFHELASILSVP